jgi:hypothetical protein
LAGAALVTALPTAACGSVPSKMWLGVERVVLNCTFDASAQPALQASLCRQLRAAAQRLTGHHVTLATRADLDRRPPGLTGSDNHLLINIDARLTGGKDSASSLLVAVLPERAGGRTWEGPWSRPSPVAVTWKGQSPVVGSPVRSLELLLGNRPIRGRAPLRSDRY